MIDFGTGNNQGVCFAVITNSKGQAQLVRDMLSDAGFKVEEPETEDFRGSRYLVFNDYVAVHSEQDDEQMDFPIMTLNMFTALKVVKRDTQYPTYVQMNFK